jgi:hypothetical protein
MPTQKQHGVGQLLAIRQGLQIEIEGRALCADVQRQGRLTDLARADQGNCGLACEGGLDL